MSDAFFCVVFFFQAEDGIRDTSVTGVQTCALPISEDLARIRLAHKDDKAALPYLAEALTGDAKREDLWFVQAQAAERLKDSSLAIRSLEQGLALGGAHPVEGASLARLYLATNQKTKASELVQQIAAALPQDR